MSTLQFKLFLLSWMMLLFVSCRKDDDEIDKPQNINDNELITTMKVSLKESDNPLNELQFVARDLDGEGALPLTIDTIRLMNGVSYDAEILLLNEAVSPVDAKDPKQEIGDVEEGDQHLIVYETSGGADLTINRTDADENGVVIGLTTTVKANSATSSKNGKLRISLKHQGDAKTADPAAPVNESVGSTDLEIEFPVIVQ